jgi:chemotaxis protein methyltransferase WspC
MMLAAIETLLKRRIGLDAATVGASTIARAVRVRQAACQLPDIQRYQLRLLEAPEELQALIDAVVVPETWFFRDRGALDAMVRIVDDEMVARRPVRLFSIPCSTGEEPYSMSMALLDSSVLPDRWRIEAVDVSTRALELARNAVYARNAFRGADLGFRDRHFEPVSGGFRPSETVRRSVHFAQGNLLDVASLPAPRSQDVIFCRNVLIYFDRATQDAALQVLHRLLAPGGVLFLGPSETALPSKQDFIWMRLPMAFAFRKAPEGSAAIVQTPPRAVPMLRPAAPPVRPLPVARALPQTPPPTEPRASLTEAQRLADAGHLAEAVQHCEAVMREGGPSADAFHLLGLLRDAAGSRQEAMAQYRKALYLEPHHQQALAHLALLLEQEGDADGARRLRERMRRSAQTGDR